MRTLCGSDALKACDQEGGNVAKNASVPSNRFNTNNFRQLSLSSPNPGGGLLEGRIRRKCKGHNSDNFLLVNRPTTGDVTHREIAAAATTCSVFYIATFMQECVIHVCISIFANRGLGRACLALDCSPAALLMCMLMWICAFVNR